MVPVTNEATWLRFLQDAREWRPPATRTVVIAPHPDDETLGAGGLIAAQRLRNVPVLAIAVTDGEAAYMDRAGLAERRRAEQEQALAELGISSKNTVRLSLPDSDVTRHEGKLVELVRTFIQPGDLLLAPWHRDPHPDHEVCGRAAQAVADQVGATLVSYLFWTWHYSNVESLNGLPLRRFDVDEHCQAARAKALAHHKSQLAHESESPVLPDLLLAPARRAFETFIVHE